MKLYLLDAGGAGLVLGIMIVFMIAVIVIEALIMMLMKYNKAGKAFLDSFLINLVSLVAGYLIVWVNGDLVLYTSSVILNLLILCVITVAVEFAVLYLLNQKHKVSKTFPVSVVMNIASYLVWYLFTEA